MSATYLAPSQQPELLSSKEAAFQMAAVNISMAGDETY